MDVDPFDSLRLKDRVEIAELKKRVENLEETVRTLEAKIESIHNLQSDRWNKHLMYLHPTEGRQREI